MAELDRKISQLDSASTFPIGSLIVASIEDQQSESGYTSANVESSVIASQMLGSYGFPLVLTKTTSKNVLGAINEIAFKEVSGTLSAGSTSITLSDASILTTSTFDIFTDVYGVAPESVTVATGSITMTFEAQESALGVKVRVY